jgi:hypothetical protein
MLLAQSVPVKVRISRPLAMSHSRAVGPNAESTETRNRLSGENATLSTLSLCPCKTRSSL